MLIHSVEFFTSHSFIKLLVCWSNCILHARIIAILKSYYLTSSCSYTNTNLWSLHRIVLLNASWNGCWLSDKVVGCWRWGGRPCPLVSLRSTLFSAVTESKRLLLSLPDCHSTSCFSFLLYASVFVCLISIMQTPNLQHLGERKPLVLLGIGLVNKPCNWLLMQEAWLQSIVRVVSVVSGLPNGGWSLPGRRRGKSRFLQCHQDAIQYSTDSTEDSLWFLLAPARLPLTVATPKGAVFYFDVSYCFINREPT